MDNKYANAKIYKICDNDETTIYIGSTINALNKVLIDYGSKYLQWKNKEYHSNLHVFKIFNKYGFENCKIVLIENPNVDSKDKLVKRVEEITKNENDQMLFQNKKKEAEQKKNPIIEKIEKQELQRRYDKEQFTCRVCGGKYTTQSKSQHEKTKMHIRNIL